MSKSYVYTSLTDGNFSKEVIECPEPVLVVFTHESSGNLQIVFPVLDQVLPKYAEKIKIGYIDTGHAEETASQYRIREIPTLLFFKGGIVVDFLIGLFRKKDLASRLQNFLMENPEEGRTISDDAEGTTGSPDKGGN